MSVVVLRATTAEEGQIDIILIPGLMLDEDLWRDIRPGLEMMGRVIDADTAHDATIAAMAARALTGLGKPALVVGFSMGGYVAREMVYQAPAKVSHLALVATSSRGQANPPSRPPLDSGKFTQLSRAAVAGSLHPCHRSDALISRVQAMSRRLGADVYRKQALADRPDDRDRLRQINCPTLIVAAAQDEIRSIAESEELRDGIAGSTLAIIGPSGHLVPLEQPAALLRALIGLLGE